MATPSQMWPRRSLPMGTTHRLPQTLTHMLGYLTPAEAKRLWDKLEVHHTPKHGSWLNVAEIELSVLGRPCLDRRVADQGPLAAAVAAWGTDRTAEAVTVDWHFTTTDARTTLKHLYPTLLPVT